MEKIFSEMQGKNYSSGVRKRKMVLNGVELTLLVDNWKMDRGAISLVWEV